MNRRTDWRPAASRIPSGARPLLAGRETEYGVHLAGNRSRGAALEIIAQTGRRYPSVGGDRHGGVVDPSSVFTDNEVFYLDLWTAGGQPRYTLEAAGYESDDPWMLQRRALLSEARIRACTAEVEQSRGLDPGAISVLALGDDFYHGRTRGYHFNAMIDRVFDKDDQATLGLWLIAASALLGAGGLGGGRGVVCDGRIGHLNAFRGGSISYGNRVRGLFSIGRGQTAGESGHRLQMMHQGPTRLSMILHDGLTLLVLRAIESGRLRWRDPLEEGVSQMRSLNICHDPLAFRLKTVSGRGIGVLEVLRWFGQRLEVLGRTANSELPVWSRRLLPVFATLCRAARAGDRLFLARRLDSWLRWRLYDEVAFEKHGLRLAGLSPWMPIAAHLGREGIFSHWKARKGRRARRPRMLLETVRGMAGPPRDYLEHLAQQTRVSLTDTGFPRYMDAIRDLADLEFSLGSAREDNPLPMLARCGYVEPLFGEELRLEAGAPAPVGRNRSRARAVLIRRHVLNRATGGRERLLASWNHMARQRLDEKGETEATHAFDLSDPLMRGIPRARKISGPMVRPALRRGQALLLAEFSVRGRPALRRGTADPDDGR